MSHLLDQTEADQIVISNLLDRIKELERSHNMTLLKDNDGNVVQVTGVELVSREQLQNRIIDFENGLNEARQALEAFDQLSAPTDVEAIPEAEQVQPEAEAAPEQPVATPIEVTEAAPENTEAEQPTEPQPTELPAPLQ